MKTLIRFLRRIFCKKQRVFECPNECRYLWNSLQAVRCGYLISETVLKSAKYNFLCPRCREEPIRNFKPIERW